MAEDLGSGVVTIDLDSAQAEGEAVRLGDRIQAVLDRASRQAGQRIQRNLQAAIRSVDTAVTIRAADVDTQRISAAVDAALSTLDATVTIRNADVAQGAVQRAVNTALQGLDATVRINDADVNRSAVQAAVDAALSTLDATVTAQVDLDDAAARAAIARLGETDVTVNANVDVDRNGSIGRVGKALGGLTRGLGAAAGGMAKFGVIAAGATQAIVSIGSALAPAAGAIVALPAVALGAAAAMGTLKLAMSGFGDALKNIGDPAKFAEAIKKLSPAAQEAAKAVQGLQPQLKAVQQAVQESFFSQFSGQIQGAITNLLPLKSGLQGISAEFGKAASEGLKFLSSQDALKGIGSILTGTKGALSGLSTATQPVLKGFLDVAAAISEAFGSKLGSAIGSAGAQFGTFLSNLAASGKAVELLKGAGAVFSQLGAIASSVGGILSSVFQAAGGGAGPLLSIIGDLAERLNQFFQSAAGAGLLKAVFDTLHTAVAALSPVFDALFSIVQQLAPVFSSALTAIAPLFTVIGDAVGQLLTALGPLIAQLAGALVPVFSQIVSAITPVIDALVSALLPVLPPIVDAFTTLLAAVAPLIGVLGGALASVISALAPLLATVGTALAQVATAIAPLITQLVDGLAPILAQLGPIVAQVVAAIAPLITQLVTALMPALPPLVDAFLAIVNALLPLIPPFLQLVQASAQLDAFLISLLGPVIQFAAEMAKWTVINVTVPIIQALVSVLGGLISGLASAISGVVSFVQGTISFFSNLGTTVPALVSSLVSSVTGFFSGLWTTVTGLVSAGVSTVVGFFAGLPGRARAAISGLVGALSGVVNSAKSAVVSAVTGLVSQAVGLVRGLPGKAKAALGALSGYLVSAGQDLIRGMINGIKAMAGSLVSAAKGVVKGAVDGAKSLLGISSPSKVFAEIGKFVGQGFIKGMTGTASDIKQTAEQLAQKVRDAFKGKNTRLDDNLIKSINATSKKLQGLADQRDAIAAKIKQANEFAAQTSQNALQGFSLQNLAKNGGGVDGLTNGIEAAIAKVRTFNSQINDLAKRGLRKDLLGQIIGLGPDQGAALASTISKASSSQLDDLNAAQAALAKSTKKLGTDSADALFDAGKNAARGFLTGLKSQQRDIEDTMLVIAKGMATAIKKALKIKSPSRVMMAIGRQTMAGLDVGVDRNTKAVYGRLRAVGDRMGVILPRTLPTPSLGALDAITRPFDGAARPSFAPAAAAGRSSVGGAAARPVASKVVNVGGITLNATGYTDADAQRVINRIATVGGL